MSKWYEIKDIDDLSVDEKDLNINFDSDEFGNIYVSVPLEMVREMLKTKKK